MEAVIMNRRIKFTAALIFCIAAMFIWCDGNLLDVTRGIGEGTSDGTSDGTPDFEDDFWAFAVSDTGQTGCWDASGGPISCTGTGQDGAYIDIPNARNFTGPTQHATYTDDYTTTDNVTGLIWKTCSEGRTGSDCSGGSAGTYIWSNALTVCTDLNSANSGAGYAGRTDWRLPSIEELNTIPNYGVYNPAIDAAFFPNTASSYYWSSSTYVVNTDSAWVVNFGDGAMDSNGKAVNYYVRCVSGP